MTNASDRKLLPLPDVGDFIFLFVIWLSLFVLPNMFFTDGSTGWHLVTGDYIIQTGAIPKTDLFSNTFPDKPWVAYEWLFDLFIAGLVKVGGLKLLAVVLSATIGFLFLSIYDRSRKSGCNIPIAFFLVIIAILTSATHWLARPHLVMFVCIWIFVIHLEDAYQGLVSRKRLLITLGLTMLVWVNSHPGFIVGFVLNCIYMASAFMQLLFNKSSFQRAIHMQRFVSFAFLFCVLSISSHVNPYGIDLHKYIFEYLKGSEVIAATNEYFSPVFHGGLHPTCLEILLFALALGLFLARKQISLPAMLTCLAFGHAALSAVRGMPLFAIAATSTIASLYAPRTSSSAAADQAEPGSPDEPGAITSGVTSDTSVDPGTTSDSAFSTAGATDTESNSTGDIVSGSPTVPTNKLLKSLSDFNVQEAQCKMHIIPIVVTLFLIGVALNNGNLMGNQLVKSDFDPTCMPVYTLKYIQDHRLDPKKGFNFDNWGGLLRYKLNERVFIDDRADFYGQEFYAEYSTVMAVGDGWEKILDRRGIEWVLFPRGSRLADTLRQSKNWRIATNDEGSELFVRANQ